MKLASLLALLGLIFCSASISGCDSHSQPPAAEDPAELTEYTAMVAGPVDASMKVHTSVAEWELAEDGSFTASAPASGGTQIAMVTTADGDPMLLGWLDQSRRTINARTTAEVIAYYALGGYLLPFNNQLTLIEALEDETSVDALAAVIEAAIETDNRCLVTADSDGAQAIRTALTAMSAELQGKWGTQAEAGRSNPLARLSISPSDGHSGVRVIADSSTVNTVEIINEYRRRGYVYIQQESWTRESDGQIIITDTPHESSPLWLSPTRGVADGTIAVTEDIFEGIYDVGTFAYQPLSAGLFALSLPDGAESATYKVTVIGPGASFGDLEDLSTEQRNQFLYVSAYSLVADVIVPAIMNVALPMKTYGDGGDDIFNELLTGPSGAAIVEDMVNVVLADPQVVTALTDGEFVVALKRSWETVIQGGAFQDLAKNFITYSVMALQNFGAISVDQMNNAMNMTYKMGRVLNGLAIADIILGAGDLGVVIAHIGMSDMANIWTIEALPVEVKINPEETFLDPFDTVNLTATVPELTGSTSTAQFEYHWSCTGNNGTITDSIGHSGTDFDSSSDFVAYIAENGTEGGDTVTVTVSQIITSSTGTSVVELGSATASICVGDNCVWLSPAEAELEAGKSVTLQLNVLVAEDRGGSEDLTFQWTCPESVGIVADGGTEKDSTITYRAGFHADDETETISAEAFLPDDTGAPESLGTDEATVTVAPPAIEIDPVAPFLALDESVTLYASVTPQPDEDIDGTLSYEWSCTSSYGTLTSDDHTATYAAGTSSTGTDQIDVQVTLTTPAGSTLDLGSAAVNAVVQSGTSGSGSSIEITNKPSSAVDFAYYSTASVGVKVLDSRGEPAENVEISLTANGVAHFDQSTILTGSDGTAAATLSADSAGSVIVTASASGVGSDSSLWVFDTEVSVSPTEGQLTIDNDIESLTMTLSPSLSGVDLEYVWGYPQLPRNWTDYIGALEADEDFPYKADLYAGWAPDGRVCIYPAVYAEYGDQTIDLGSTSYCYETTYNPTVVGTETWSETEETVLSPYTTLYSAKVYGGFRWSGSATQYRYFAYKQDRTANYYGQEWHDSDIACDGDDDGIIAVAFYNASSSFESESDRSDWIAEHLDEAATRMEAFDYLEYQAIAEDWPPTENGCR